MAYFANLNNNIVLQVIVVSDTIDDGQAWCVETFGGVWVEGSRASIGYTYDAELDVFVAPPAPEPVEP